jgi:hypothetical protein
MVSMWRCLLIAGAMATMPLTARAQARLATDDAARVDAAVRNAFAFLYALPSDAAAAPMESWVLDSASTTREPDLSGRWRILVTKLTDTGHNLTLKEMAGEPGTSPAQLAAAAAAMQRLEGKISKADADAAVEIVITINPPEDTVHASSHGQRTTLAIPGSQMAVRAQGHWSRHNDPELEVDYQRWSPASIAVAFGSVPPPPGTRGIHAVVVTAQGNEEMLARVIKETRWDLLARLLN